MRICFDLDGTICEIKKENQNYEDVLPINGAIETIKELKNKGHTIIIHTARNMKTQNHNIGKVLKNVGLITLNWLEKHNVLYDEIYFGKPNADITIDDRSLRFKNWQEISEEVLLKNAKEK